MNMKFYLFALFIAFVAFGGTSFIMRYRQATAAAAPTKLTIAAPRRGGLPRHVVIDRRRAMEDRQDAAIETSQGALLPDLSRTRRGEPIKRRDHGEETLAEIGHSYNVSGWTIARLGNTR